MTRHIIVSPPVADMEIVRTGTTWYIERTNKVCLLMGKITDSVFNVAFWDEGGELGDKSTEMSMLAADVLVYCAELIAEPLPELVEMIEGAENDASRQALARFEARQVAAAEQSA